MEINNSPHFTLKIWASILRTDCVKKKFGIDLILKWEIMKRCHKYKCVCVWGGGQI